MRVTRSGSPDQSGPKVTKPRVRENLWADVVSSIIIPKTSHPDPRACGRVTSCGRGDSAGGVKAPEMRITLDSPGGAQCHHRTLIRGRGRVRGRGTGGAALLAVRMEGGAMSQGCGTSGSWKRQELVL